MLSLLPWVCILLCSVLGVQSERSKDCDTLEVAYLLKASQVKIISQMQSGSSCEEAYESGKKQLDADFEICFPEQNRQKTLYKETEETRFGNKDTYCDYGGLRSIRNVLNYTQKSTSKYNISLATVKKCENPFYDEFRRNIASSALCLLYKETHDCQNSILIASGTTLVDQNFEDPAMTSEFIPYCPNIKKLLDIERKKILDGEGHATSSDFIVPVVVICCLFGAAILVGMCWLTRRERAKKKTKGGSTQQQIPADIGPKNGTAEAIPLATVTSENEGISTA